MMRITKISVKKLFGVFDHEIPLNQESRITIIHGPNGVGKTVLMRMVHGLFHHDYEFLGEIQYRELRIYFDQGRSISVEKREDIDSLLIHYDDATGTDYTPFKPQYDATEVELGMYMKALEPNLSLVASGDRQYWWDREHKSLFTQEDILNRFPNALLAIYGEMPSWFDHMRQNVSTEFIPIERLRSDEVALLVWLNKVDRNGESDTPSLSLPTIPQLSYRMEVKLNDVLSLPARLTEDIELNLNPATQAIRAASKKLSEAASPAQMATAKKEMRNALKSADDLWKRHDIREATFRQSYNAWKRSPDTQLWDDEERMFQDLLDELIMFKEVRVDTDAGLVIEGPEGCMVPLERLSSGEQHVIMLYYRLLFETDPDSLVMIDEPELSLHVNWQEQFLDDIQRVSDLRQFDVLIATHSPDIINDKHEWMVELGESVPA